MKKFGKYRTSRQGHILVNKNGRVYYNNVKKLKAEIDAGPGTDAEKRDLKASLDALVKTRHKNNVRDTRQGKSDIKQLTDTSFFNKQKAGTKLEKMFRNLGYESDELSVKFNFDEARLLDEKNWTVTKTGTIVFDSGSGQYKLVWTYTGSIFERI